MRFLSLNRRHSPMDALVRTPPLHDALVRASLFALSLNRRHSHALVRAPPLCAREGFALSLSEPKALPDGCASEGSATMR